MVLTLFKAGIHFSVLVEQSKPISAHRLSKARGELDGDGDYGDYGDDRDGVYGEMKFMELEFMEMETMDMEMELEFMEMEMMDMEMEFMAMMEMEMELMELMQKEMGGIAGPLWGSRVGIAVGLEGAGRVTLPKIPSFASCPQICHGFSGGSVLGDQHGHSEGTTALLSHCPA